MFLKTINLIMITSLSPPTQLKNLLVVTFGFIMSVLFGFLNVTLKKKMGILILRVFKILIRKGSKRPA